MQKRFSSIAILRIALLLGFLGSLVILAFSLLDRESVFGLVMPMAFYGFCHAMLGLQVEVKVSSFFSELVLTPRPTFFLVRDVVLNYTYML